jgi:hypothetical protein
VNGGSVVPLWYRPVGSPDFFLQLKAPGRTILAVGLAAVRDTPPRDQHRVGGQGQVNGGSSEGYAVHSTRDVPLAEAGLAVEPRKEALLRANAGRPDLDRHAAGRPSAATTQAPPPSAVRGIQQADQAGAQETRLRRHVDERGSVVPATS